MPAEELPILQWLEQEYQRVHMRAAVQQMSGEAPERGEAMIRGLRAEVEDLKRQLHGLFNRIGAQSFFDGPTREVFAGQDNDNGAFEEMIPENGTLVTFTGGRSADAGDPNEYIDLDSDQAVFLSVLDAAGDKLRTIKISSVGSCDGDQTLGESGMKAAFTGSGGADGTFWDRTSSTTSPAAWLVTGFRESPASPGNCKAEPPKIYMYKRLFTEDTKGGLCAVGTEVESLFATGCCPEDFGLSAPVMATVDDYKLAQAAALSMPGTV